MADFQTSTHRSKWIFSSQELLEKYIAANARAINSLQQYGATRLEVNVDGSLSRPEPLLDLNNAQCPSLPKPLSCEEERLMRIFYEHKIQEVCAAFRFPHKIQGTAILYFKRFYLQWSVMVHHPKHIMLTCIYASCKVEENHVSAEELGKGIQQDHQVILNNEMVVLQSLNFDLIVYSPYRSIEGFVDDMEEMFIIGAADQAHKFRELRRTARLEADKIMLTDAPLLFPPGQLALAALQRSNELHRLVDFQSYLDNILSRQYSSHTTMELNQSFGAIDMMVSKLVVPSMKELRHIDRKLTACWDPSSQDDNKKREKKSKHKSKRSSSEAHERHPAI